MSSDGQMVIKGEIMADDAGTALAAITRSEMDVQVSTAKMYPRDLDRSLDRAMSMALKSKDIAAGMFYSLPRAGRDITGPSVRLAEVLATTWGNLRVQARVVEVGERFLVAQGMAHDLEANLATSVEVRRRIMDKNGRRFNDDMIQVTANAACSIAIRQALFKVIPRVYVDEICAEARKAAIGDVKTLAASIASMLEHFAKMGVFEEQILLSLGYQSTKEITLSDLERLRGRATAILDGELAIEEVFPRLETAEKAAGSTAPAKPTVTGADLAGKREPPKKTRRGRPKGSKNKPKASPEPPPEAEREAAEAAPEAAEAAPEPAEEAATMPAAPDAGPLFESNEDADVAEQYLREIDELDTVSELSRLWEVASKDEQLTGLSREMVERRIEAKIKG